MSPLDQQRERIQDDLRGLVAGEVRCDDVFLQLFASDASIYEIKPLAVVRPRSTADVAACVQYAAEKQHPHPRPRRRHRRGGRIARAGAGARFLRPPAPRDPHRRETGSACSRAWSTSGSTTSCGRLGRMFGPDPATSSVTTIGSMIAIDAAGSRWLKYGSTRRHVQSLQVVLADGQVLEVGREPLVDGASTSAIPRKRELVNRLAALLTRAGRADPRSTSPRAR